MHPLPSLRATRFERARMLNRPAYNSEAHATRDMRLGGLDNCYEDTDLADTHRRGRHQRLRNPDQLHPQPLGPEPAGSSLPLGGQAPWPGAS
jgi:hypothetical protein